MSEQLRHLLDVVERLQRETPKENLDWGRFIEAYYAFKALDVPAVKAAEEAR